MYRTNSNQSVIYIQESYLKTKTKKNIMELNKEIYVIANMGGGKTHLHSQFDTHVFFYTCSDPDIMFR